MAAVAVHDVLLKTCLIEPDIKWPNDVLVREKKICGILSEAVDTPQGLAVVLGIGINLKDEGLPENATAVKAVSTVEIDRDQLVDALIEQLDEAYRRLNSRPASIIDEWKERSTYFEDKAVEVRSGRDAFSGVTCGLEENGALRVRLADGSVRIVQAGDVERVRADN
jgi:BirA family biotin operon repressor/biotin-[acetyl-CoA-carboxylase] ligase